MIYNTELYSELRPYLHPNEQVLWVGKPDTVHMPKNGMFPALFAVFFMGFAIFWMAMASQAGGFFFLFGVPFLIVGAVTFYGATLGKKNGLKKSVYAVTETRAMIIVTLPRQGTSCKEYILSNLATVSLEDVKDGVGTIRFEEVNVYGYEYGRYNRRRTSTYSPERELTTAFLSIHDVHSVYHMISERLGKRA